MIYAGMNMKNYREKQASDIIIFGGQSNMQGQTERLSESQTVECAYEYKFFDNAFVPLKNPVGEDMRYDGYQGESVMHDTDLAKWLSEHVLGSACYGHTNLVPAFARAYVKKTNSTLIAIHAAKGSTCIQEWLPGTKGYQALTTKTLSGIQKAKEIYDIRHIYFVWLQGESDAIVSTDKKTYKERMKQLAKGLREDLGVECFGVIRVGSFTGDDRDIEIQTAQDEVCQEDSFFQMLTDCTRELTKEALMMNPYVGGHYSAAGLERIGELAGDAFGTIACW